VATPLTQRIAAVAVNGALTQALLAEDERSVGGAAIVGGAFVPDTAQAAQGVTNFATLQLRRRRAAATVAVLGTLNLGTAVLVAGVPADFVMTTDPGGQLDDVIDVNVLQTGTGAAVPAGTVEVEID